MMQKFVVLAVVTLAGAALFVPDVTFARGGMGGGIGGFRAGGFRASAVIHRAPFMVRTGRSALGHNGFARITHPSGALPQPVARHLPVHTDVRRPFAHFARRDHSHHHRFVSAWIYPFTTWDDGSYIGVPYDPGASIPVYAPGPIIDPVIDPAPQGPVPRVSGIRYEAGEACHAERVTVPGDKDEREITVVRC
jgi:hypothetical protein